MKNADLGGRRKVRSGRQMIFNSVAQPQPAARERMVMVVPMMSSRSIHGEYVKCGSSVRSSAGVGLKASRPERGPAVILPLRGPSGLHPTPRWKPTPP